MIATTYREFNGKTEGVEVAKAFADAVRGKSILVTGVNRGGIGFTTAEAFASQAPAHIIIAGRSPSKIQESIDALEVRFPNVHYRPLKLDLSVQQSVRTAAAEVLSWSDVPSIDILVNSAGVMNISERTLSKDGIEMHFATNYIGHFLFSCLIMPKLLKSANGNPKGATRLINVSSASPQVACMRWSDINFEKRNKDLPEAEQPPYDMHRRWGTTDPEDKAYLPLEGYNQSKVASVLFSVAANKRLYEKHGILSLAVHPGVIRTELSRHNSPETRKAIEDMLDKGWFPIKTMGAGAATSLVAALDPNLGVDETKGGKESYGVYLVDCQISDKASPKAVSSDEAEKLWKLSEDLVNQKFAW